MTYVNEEDGFTMMGRKVRSAEPLKILFTKILITMSLALSTVTATATTVTGGGKVDFIDPLADSAVTQGGGDLSPVGMFMTADGVVQGVIILLLFASLLTWTVGIAKWIELRRERRQMQQGLRKVMIGVALGSVGETGCAPLSEMIVQAEDEVAASTGGGAGISAEGMKDRISLRLTRLEASIRRRAGRGVGILAIVGSMAPFVGLFGTVWGIMNSFIGIAQSHTTNLAVVAPGIAEALLTTAVGLVAAIPAGVMYNVFARALAGYTGELGDAGAAVLCLAAREIDLKDVRI